MIYPRHRSALKPQKKIEMRLLPRYSTSTSFLCLLLLNVFLSAEAIEASSSVSAVWPSSRDTPFDQENPFLYYFSNKQAPSTAYKPLPFPSTSSIISLGVCIVALSLKDGTLYSSARESPSDYNQIKTTLVNPWEDFASFLSLEEDVGSGVTGLQILASTNDASLFYVITPDDILEVKLDSNTCNKVTSTRSLMEGEKGQWGNSENLLITSSADKIFISVEKQITVWSVDIASGDVLTLDFTLSSIEPSVVTALYFVQQWERLYVGTEVALYTLSSEGAYIYHEWINGVIDFPPVDFAFDPDFSVPHKQKAKKGALWLAERDAVHRLDALGRWYRFGYHQGNPFSANITSVSVSGGYTWVGSGSSGIGRILASADPSIDDTLHVSSSSPQCSTQTYIKDKTVSSDPWKWKYFGGNRYLVDNRVHQLVQAGSVGAISDANNEYVAAVAVTDLGISILEVQQWTLKEKAEAYLPKQARHDNHGLIVGYNNAGYGDPSEGNQGVGDNDGLWTSMHVIGEAYAYALDGDEATRKRAWNAFEGLEKLFNVTGAYPSFPARSFCYGPDGVAGCGSADGDDRWHPSETMPGYYWKDDTSSDETDGHLAAYPVLYDLVAQSPEEKQRVYNLIDGLTGGMVNNDLYLIDPSTGERTTWGFWNPSELNGEPEHYSERPTNSLGILAYLASAYSVTGKTMYKDQFTMLAGEHQYVMNTMNEKIDNPDDDNHSDNELISLTYHILFYAWYRLEDGSAMKEELRLMVEPLMPGAERTWQLIGAEFNPLWVSVYIGLGGIRATPEYIERSVYYLRRQALDLLDWPCDHTVRDDVTITPNKVRDNPDKLTIKEILPPDNRPTAHFNTDIYVTQGGSGMTEFEPAVYRLPYYAMRYYGLLE